MATTDINGMVFYATSDLVTPLAANINAVSTATTNALNSATRTFRVADQAARDALLTARGASASAPLQVDRADTGNIERNITGVIGGWVVIISPSVEGAISYGAGWRTPTTQPQPPITLVRVGTEVTLRGGSIENSTTLSLGTNGQVYAFSLPAGFFPLSSVRIPAVVNVTGITLATAQIIVGTDGGCIVQTTTAISSAAAGVVSFALPAVRWITS